MRNPKTGRSSQDIAVHGQGRRSSTPRKSAPSCSMRRGKSSTCSATWSTTARSKSRSTAWTRGQYFGMADARLVPAGGRRSVPAQFRQGVFRHLADDGAGDQLRGDVQHVSQRTGGDAGHGGDPGHRLLYRRTSTIWPTGITQGGGPFESLVRIVKQQNMVDRDGRGADQDGRAGARRA